MHSRCCWPPDRPSAFCLSLSLTSSHSAAWRSACSTRSSISAATAFVVADAVGDVVVDRHRERHRLLEHHADLAAQPVQRVLRVEDVLAVQQHLAAGVLPGIQRIDAVEHAQQRRLAAARRADQRGHLLLGNVQVDVLERLLAVVEEIDAARGQLVRCDLPEAARDGRRRDEASMECRMLSHGATLLRSRMARAARPSSSTKAVTTKAPAQASEFQLS